MKLDESALVVHHTMTYKVQTHMFFMSHTNLLMTRFTVGEGRIIQSKTLKQIQLIFPRGWINEYEHNNKPLQIHEPLQVDRLIEGRVSVSFLR